MYMNLDLDMYISALSIEMITISNMTPDHQTITQHIMAAIVLNFTLVKHKDSKVSSKS